MIISEPEPSSGSTAAREKRKEDAVDAAEARRKVSDDAARKVNDAGRDRLSDATSVVVVEETQHATAPTSVAPTNVAPTNAAPTHPAPINAASASVHFIPEDESAEEGGAQVYFSSGRDEESIRLT